MRLEILLICVWIFAIVAVMASICACNSAFAAWTAVLILTVNTFKTFNGFVDSLGVSLGDILLGLLLANEIFLTTKNLTVYY